MKAVTGQRGKIHRAATDPQVAALHLGCNSDSKHCGEMEHPRGIVRDSHPKLENKIGYFIIST